MDSRALQNPYRDYDGNNASALFGSDGKITDDFSQRLCSKIKELLAVMEDGLNATNPQGCTVYLGWAGISLLYLHLHDVFKDQSYLQMAHGYVSRALKQLTRRRDITFMLGDTGPLAVAAVVSHRLQRPKEADEYVSRLLQYHQAAMSSDVGLSDELLYGRIGYLYTLIFVRKHLGEERVPLHLVQQISAVVLQSGEHLSRKLKVQSQSPLMYAWYKEQYVGAAHGLAGIYYFLMQPGFVSSPDSVQTLVKPSVDHVCRLRFPSGNYPPAVQDEHDQLVHWCHGAPGVVYMLLQAHQVHAGKGVELWRHRVEGNRSALLSEY